MFFINDNEESNLKGTNANKNRVQKSVHPPQSGLRLADSLWYFKISLFSTATFLQSSCPHTSYSGFCLQPCNEFKKAFNCLACLNLH